MKYVCNFFVVQIYASPIYEFMDTYFEKSGSHEWSTHSVVVRLITRTTYIMLSTFLGALLPFFGDFVFLTGALAAFPLEAGLVHHMYLKVNQSPRARLKPDGTGSSVNNYLSKILGKTSEN